MTRMDRAISGLFGMFFLSALTVFAVMYIAMDSLSLMTTFENVTIAAMSSYYPWFLPEVIYRMMPVAAMVAMVFTLNSMNRSNELIALFALGYSLVRITMPILVWVILLCGLQLYLSDQILPNFTRQKNFIFYNEIQRKPHLYSTVKTNKIWYRSKNNLFYIRTLNEKTHRAQGFTLYAFDDQWNLLQMIAAEEADIAGSQWTLFNGSVTVFRADSSFPLTQDFKTKQIAMGEDSKDLSQTTAHTSDTLNLKELSEFILKNKSAGLDTVRYEVDYHSKFGYAIAAFVMVLLAIPFSVGKARSGGVMKGVGISLGLVCLYWVLYNSALTLGRYGQIPAVFASWGPNLGMSILALYYIRLLKR